MKKPIPPIVDKDGKILGAGRKVRNPEGLAHAANETRRTYDIWLRLKGRKKYPSLAGWLATPHPDLAPSILVVDVLADGRDFRYRLVGPREIEMRGDDPTGGTVREAFTGDVLAFVLANYELALKSPNGFVDFSIEVDPEHRRLELETLFLPLSDDGQSVSHILVYSHYISK